MVEITNSQSILLFKGEGGTVRIPRGSTGYLCRWSPRLKTYRDGKCVPVRFPKFYNKAFIAVPSEITVPNNGYNVLVHTMMLPVKASDL